MIDKIREEQLEVFSSQMKNELKSALLSFMTENKPNKDNIKLYRKFDELLNVNQIHNVTCDITHLFLYLSIKYKFVVYDTETIIDEWKKIGEEIIEDYFYSMLKVYNGAIYLRFRKRELKSYDYTIYYGRNDIYFQYFQKGMDISFQEFQEFLHENNL
jgi:hypothetical protein